MGWNKITKRISELISTGKFLSETGRAAMPEYERKQLARSIHSFFYDTPEGYPKPFSQNVIERYWEGVQTVQAQLTDPVRVEEIYQTMMLPLWEAALQDDRHYESRRAGLENMRAYLDGTYSVFNRAHTLSPLSEITTPEPTAPELPTAGNVADTTEPNTIKTTGSFMASSLAKRWIRYAPVAWSHSLPPKAPWTRKIPPSANIWHRELI